MPGVDEGRSGRKEKEGTVTLMHENDQYYVVSNKIDNKNYLN